MQGHSVVICRCRVADGFLPCPDEALKRLTPTYPPAAYAAAAADIVTPPPPKLTVHQGGKMYNGGYTGSICELCGSARMRRSGTCETCEDCGNAGGCG